MLILHVIVRPTDIGEEPEDNLNLPTPPSFSSEQRRRGNFCAHVPMSIKESDGLMARWRYGNYWKVTFADQEVSEAMALFRHDPSELWAMLALWVQEKVRAKGRRERITRKKLVGGLGLSKEGKRISGTTLTPVLKMMVERGDLIKRKVGTWYRTKRGAVKMEDVYLLPSQNIIQRF